jgi:hypothetical protein
MDTTQKRVRNVFPTREIAHLWAHQTQPDARNPQGNFFFVGDTIYSYRTSFPVGRLVKNGHEIRAALITAESYSVTTSGHIHMARNAARHLKEFEVPNPAASLFKCSLDLRKLAAKALKDLRAAKSNPQRAIRFRELEGRVDKANIFNVFFGYSARVEMPSDTTEIFAITTAWEQARERRREAREANRSRVFRERRERDRAEAAELAVKMPQLLDSWRAGNTVPELGYYRLYSLPVMLRVSGEEIETSLGARFPIDHAKRGIQFIRKVVASGNPFQANGHRFPLGNYKIETVDANGNVKAGCHYVTYPEIERLAGVLGV